MGVAFRELPVGRSRWRLPQSRDRELQGSTHCGYCVHGTHLLSIDHDHWNASTPATRCAIGVMPVAVSLPNAPPTATPSSVMGRRSSNSSTRARSSKHRSRPPSTTNPPSRTSPRPIPAACGFAHALPVPPGTTTGKSALTSAFGPRFLRLGQRRRARGTYRPGSAHRWRYQLTRSFAPATASHRVDRICRVAVRGDRQRIGNGGCRGSAEGFSRV